MTRFLFFVLFLTNVSVFSQEFDKLPSNITSSRSVVLVSTSPVSQGGQEARGDWKTLAEKCHQGFRKIGIDGVYYMNEFDFHGGPEITMKCIELFNSRQVKNFIFVSETGGRYEEEYEIKVIAFSGKYITKELPGFRTSGKDLDNQLLRLGRTVLREQVERTNFLITDRPEYLDDLNVYSGTRYENYPGRIKGLKLAVAKFPEFPVDPAWDEYTRSEIQKVNESIQLKNKKLEAVLEIYPYTFELVDYSSPDDLYKKGYQYVLLPICSTGKAIRQMLNYKLKSAETNYITAVSADGGLKMETISSDAECCKYYIKQTVMGDLHVGSRWDADLTWYESLENFIQNLKSELK